MIIDNISEMVGWQAIRFHQHLHIYNRVFKLDFAAQCILNNACAGCWNFHPDDMGDAIAVKLCVVFHGERKACSIIFRRLFCRYLVPPHIG